MKAVQEGRITEAEVDKRVDELLDVVLSVRKAVDKLKGKPFDVEAHHAFARKCSEESIVLLKNEGNILPLKKRREGGRYRGICPESPISGGRFLRGELHQAGQHHGCDREL